MKKRVGKSHRYALLSKAPSKARKCTQQALSMNMRETSSAASDLCGRLHGLLGACMACSLRDGRANNSVHYSILCIALSSPKTAAIVQHIIQLILPCLSS